ncbi:Oxidoreductase, short chain dehydrogenase/reductase family protein [Aphelenchoides bicaudatus]|nr:Oxidoreductase, short chain dehydrogenase/reductase family protein [Aphelenchoides bicaudatus]
MANDLSGKVALVTGSSRGLGKGIAIELGAGQATVYITARPTATEKENAIPSSTIEEVAEEINKRGGKGNCCPEDVKALFEKIEKEQNGQLDLLVNNAFSGVYHMLKVMGKKFYENEDPVDDYDMINNVGLRNNYICSVYAARLMVKRNSGPIVNITSIGAVNYLFNIPYGFGKEALIRMSADMAIELADKNVYSLALMAGGVKTEIVSATVLQGPEGPGKQYFSDGESIYNPGKVIAFLASHPELLKKYNGRAVTTTEISEEHNINDVDGRKHPDPRIHNYKKFLADVNDIHLEFLPK